MTWSAHGLMPMSSLRRVDQLDDVVRTTIAQLATALQLGVVAVAVLLSAAIIEPSPGSVWHPGLGRPRPCLGRSC